MKKSLLFLMAICVSLFSYAAPRELQQVKNVGQNRSKAFVAKNREQAKPLRVRQADDDPVETDFSKEPTEATKFDLTMTEVADYTVFSLYHYFLGYPYQHILQLSAWNCQYYHHQ